MADVFISDLPAIQSVNDNTTFASDNGTQSNSVKASQLKQYILGDIDALGSVKKVNGAMPDETGNVILNIPNPNLLDNAYFGDVVNQREVYTFYNGYGIDRWYNPRTSALRFVTVGEDSVLITKEMSDCLQKIKNFGEIVGKTVTLSIMYKSDSTQNLQRLKVIADDVDVNIPTLYFDLPPSNEMTVASWTFVVPSATSSLAVGFSTISGFDGTAFEVKAIKLELGNVQTFAHQDTDGKWVLNEIPDYDEQLLKCQRYFINLNPNAVNYACYCLGVATSEKMAALIIDLPVSMRITPAILTSGKLRLFQPNGSVSKALTSTPSVFANRNAGGSKVSITANCEEGLTPGAVVMLSNNLDNTAYVWLSAEL